MAKKIIALLMAMALVLSFAACGKNETTEEQSTTEAPVSEQTGEEATSAPAEESTVEESSAAETSAPAEESSVPEESTSEAAAKAPQTKEEVVAYFNNAVNGVKSGAKSVTMNYEKITLSGSCTFPSSLNTILKLLGGADKFIGDQLAKENKGKEVFSSKDTIIGRFPVEGETWASKLTASDVSKAVCEEKDGKYYITVTTLSDSISSNISHGQGHVPKAFNAVLPGRINENIPGIAQGIVGTASMNYPASTAKIVVDAATGKVLSANYRLYWTINFEKVGAILPFCTEDDYVIAW